MIKYNRILEVNMEKIFKENRINALNFNVDGENLEVLYFNKKLFETITINPVSANTFNLLNTEKYELKSKTTSEQALADFKQTNELNIEFENEFFKKRKVTFKDNVLDFTDTITMWEKVAFFTWKFTFVEDAKLISSTPKSCLVHVAGIEINFEVSATMAISLDGRDLTISRQLRKIHEIDINFEFKFNISSQSCPNSVTPDEKNGFKYKLVEKTESKKLDVVLVPLSLTDKDLELFTEDRMDYIYHLPLVNVLKKRETNQLFIFPVYNDEINGLIAENIQSELLKFINEFTTDYKHVELVGIDSSYWSSICLFKQDTFTHTTFINPLVDIEVYYKKNKQFIDQLYNRDESFDIASATKDGLYNKKAKYIVTTYSRGYFDFIRLYENFGDIKEKDIHFRLIKEQNQIENTKIFTNNIVKM